MSEFDREPSDAPTSQPGVLRVFRSTEETRGFYNKIARVYDLLAERSEQPMREVGLALLAPQPGETLLEVGFGTGHCLAEMARAVGESGRVLGIDIAENMLSEADARLRDLGVANRIELVRGDLRQLPFDPASIDGVFSSFTLELVDTPELPAVLAEWRRVLRPGGRMVVVAISKVGPPGLMLKAFEWTHRHFPNLMDCRPIYARRAIEAASFRVDEVRVEEMWVPVEIVLAVKADS